MLQRMPSCWPGALQPRMLAPHPPFTPAHLAQAAATTAPTRAHLSASAHAATTQQPAQGSKMEGRPLGRCIGPGLALMEQRYQVAGRELVMVAPMDVDAVMDMYIESGSDGDPYWTRVWPSALALAQQLLSRPQLVAGAKVADLGAGLGVGGIAAALAGAEEVVLLDREALALQCALESAVASGVPQVQPLAATSPATTDNSSSSSSSSADSNSSSSSSSGGGDSSSSSSSSRPRLRAQVFDWHATQLEEKFDVVVACDVLYEESAVEPIAAVVPRLLKPTSGLLLLADPPNRTAQHRQRCIQLLAAAQPAGLQLQECGIVACEVAKLDPEMRGGVEVESVPVQFMVFRRALGNDTVGVKVDFE